MKKHFFISLFCLSAGLFFAQPTITSADLLQVGDIVVTQPCATATFATGSAGANQNWDFSQLVQEGPEDTTFYILPAGTPYGATYPSSNIVARFGGNQYGYYQVNAGKLLYWGQTDPGTALVLTDPAVYFKSPATFGTWVLDTIAGSLSSGPLNGVLTGHVYFEGDGYGTLVTPGGQYSDVLRLKTTTIAVATVPFLGTIIDSVFNYSWYKLGVSSPVLEMIEDTQWSNGMVVDQVRYVNFYRSLTSETQEIQDFDEPNIRAFPNPTTDQVHFSGLKKPALITIQNTAGQVVLSKTIAPNGFLQVKNLEPGIYVCAVLCDASRPQLLKLVIQ